MSLEELGNKQLFDVFKKFGLGLVVIKDLVKFELNIVGFDVFSARLGQLFNGNGGLVNDIDGAVLNLARLKTHHGLILSILELMHQNVTNLVIGL